MKTARYTYCLYSLLVGLLLTSCGAESILRKADQSYALGEYNEAAALYKKAYSKTEAKDKAKRAERAFKTAECYRRINMNAKAMAAYRNAIRYNYPDSVMYKHMADLQLQKGEYKAAVQNYDIYLEYNPTDTTAINGKKACTTAPQWKKNPTRYIVKKETFFNSRRSEYSPVYGSEDFGQLFFTSTRDKALGEDKSLITGVKAPDIFFSTKDEKGKWQKPEPLEGEVNSEYEDGACAFTPDYKTMYFTRCLVDGEAPRSAQIYKSTRSDATWSAPTLCELANDTISSFAHPAVSPDGAWLYFVSDMSGGMGGLDIWRIAITGEEFGGVENLGAAINTQGNEMFPTFRPNGDLYFSSNGHHGMGGLDIYCATQDEENRWSITNLQAPVNSANDDFGMTFEGELTRGYFSSNRGDARGWDHIYSFYLPETVHNLTGWVYEKDGYELTEGTVYLIGNDGTNEKLSVKTDGSFTKRITPGVSYVMLGSCKGFLNYKQELTADSTVEDREYVLQFPLSSITKPVLIENIFYKFDSAELTDSSTVALDELVRLLTDNPGTVIELGAHCDYKGRDEYNERLSQRRAESVVNYLISQGIEADRLVPKGYGESTPKTVTRRMAEKYTFMKEGDALTEEYILTLPEEQQEICNAENRRTEFRVLRTTYRLYE
ncbi:MAG: OmpA family protein [Bacteroidaceae bacterium]|nr:OmpA family protein [Bacteroidaceae bacterium]MBQ7968053.1 OmpA family protein [Bacteroidaceae bacterium]MBR3985174.1 OmpA family protein [Bacteroidaceae bacterium]